MATLEESTVLAIIFTLFGVVVLVLVIKTILLARRLRNGRITTVPLGDVRVESTSPNDPRRQAYRFELQETFSSYSKDTMVSEKFGAVNCVLITQGTAIRVEQS